MGKYLMTSNFKKSQLWEMYDLKMCKTQVLIVFEKNEEKGKKLHTKNVHICFSNVIILSQIKEWI